MSGGTHLRLEERERLAALKGEGLSLRAIARQLGRAASTISRELRRIYQRYRQPLPTTRGVPLYLTEYGYQTKPDPFAGKVVSFNRQAAWINQAEYMAFKNPNVRNAMYWS